MWHYTMYNSADPSSVTAVAAAAAAAGCAWSPATLVRCGWLLHEET
jgi:hypothetical protein